MAHEKLDTVQKQKEQVVSEQSSKLKLATKAALISERKLLCQKLETQKKKTYIRGDQLCGLKAQVVTAEYQCK